MGVTRFQSSVDVGSTGGADVDKLAASFEKLAGSIEGVTAKGDKLAQHPGFDSFAAKVKAGIQDPLGAAGDAMEALMQGMGPLGTSVAAGVGIFTAVAVAGFEAAKSLGTWAVQVREVELRTGFTAKQVGEFTFAAKASGQEVGIFEKMMRGLTMAVEDNSEKGQKARDWLGKFHVDMAAVRDGSVDTATVITQIAEGLEKLPTVWERNKAALDLFKKSGIEAIPVLLELREHLKEAREKGLGFSEEDAKKNAAYLSGVVAIEMEWDRVLRVMKEVAVQSLVGGPWGGPELHRRTGAPLSTSGRGVWDVAAEQDARDLARSDAELDARVKKHAADLTEALHQEMKEREAAAKAREGFLKSLTMQEQSAHDAALDSSERIVAKMNEQIAAAEKLKFSAAAMLEIRIRESAIADVELQTLAKKAAIEFDAYDRKREEDQAKARDKALIITPTLAGLAETDAGFKADAQIASIEAASERADLMRRSSRATRMAELVGGGGPLQEVTAINAGYQERLDLAGKLYDLESAAAKANDDANQGRILQAHAEADLKKEMRDADLEYELKIAELQRKRLDELRNSAGAFFDAMLQGGKGLEAFFENMAKGWARTIFQNMATELLKGQSGHLTLPGEGTAAHPTFLGKALAGTPFGIDPLKGMDPLKLATDLNTQATMDNTAALRALALSASGGGGSLGRLPGIFTRGLTPNVSSSISFGPDGGNPTDAELAASGIDQSSIDLLNGPAMGPDAGTAIGGLGRPSMGMSAGRGIGMAGAVLAGGFGAYSGFKAGGAQGALTGVGSITGAAAVLDPEPISKAILMGIAMGSGLVSMLIGDPKQNRDLAEAKTLNDARYTAPTGANYTLDRYGRSYDTDVSGAVRPIIQVTIPVSALDAKSFLDNSNQIMAAVTLGLEAKASPRLAMAIRNVAFQR